MLTVNKLEKIIELEDRLRSEYQDKLDAAIAEAERYKQQLAEEREQMQATISQQLETLQTLSPKATANEHLEQRNRELCNRSENLQEEVDTLKRQVKSLKRDLATEREKARTLAQFDPVRLRKNLNANKKKLAENAKANELLQKSLKSARGEKVELQGQLAALEKELEKLKADLGAEEKAA
jgi:chromosome segregation ATPase